MNLLGVHQVRIEEHTPDTSYCFYLFVCKLTYYYYYCYYHYYYYYYQAAPRRVFSLFMRTTWTSRRLPCVS